MTTEDVRGYLDTALDLLQLITEDVEESFIESATDAAAKARATITVSSLYILGDYLRSIGKEGREQ